MAQGNHASPTRIAFTVLIGIIAIITTMVYLGGIHDESDELLVETYYDKCVSGLSKGSVVNFRGVKVGEVKEIGLVFNRYPEASEVDAIRVYIVMALSRKIVGATEEDNASEKLAALIKRGLRAQVSSSGITGLSRIELDFYPEISVNEVRPISWTPRALYIPPQISLLDSFSESATKVMNQINKMDIDSAWSNINESVESAAKATEAIKTMIESNRDVLDRAIEDMGEAMNSVKGLAEELRRNPSLLIRERIPAPLPETEE